MANYSLNLELCGLGTTSVTIPVAAPLVFDGKLTLPTLAEGASADSQVIVSITQNGSNRLTTNPGSDGFRIQMICNPNDVIAITLSSSAAIDSSSKNIIKCTLAVG